MKKKVIVCVDDERILLQSLSMELSKVFKDNFSIEVAENGEEALELMSELIEDDYEIPVIISDYIMPLMRGDEFLTKAKLLINDSRNILLTGQATIEGISSAINNANLYRFISKPWNNDDLILTINEALKSYDDNKQLIIQNEEIKKKNAEITNININLEKLVQIRTAELREKSQEITDSINYAYRIQQAVMGNKFLIEKMYKNVSVLYMPKSIVSGDFYWFTKKDDKLIMAAGDCTGHGVPGAFMSLIGIISLNEVVNNNNITVPGKILNELRAKIINLLQQNGSSNEAKDGMDIALVSFDEKTNILEFAGAHNPCYIIREANLIQQFDNPDFQIYQDSMIVIKPDNMPIGHSERLEQPFTNQKIQLLNGDKVFLTTDGIIDQFGGPNGKKFLVKRFKDSLLEYKTSDIKLILNHIEKTFLDWKGNEEQVDDILLIGFSVGEIMNEIHNKDTQTNIICSFEGVLNEEIITNLCNEIESKLLSENIKKGLIKNIVNVSIECLQNISKYAVIIENPDVNTLNSKFSIALIDDYFELKAANYIKSCDETIIKEKIDYVNSLDEDKLKEYYMAVLDNATFNTKFGAGLGIIVMAKKSNNKIQYKFTKINEQITEYEIILKFNK